MTRAIAAAAAIWAAFFMPAAAAQQQQQMPCAQRSAVVAGLSSPEHNERPIYRGIANDNMVELWMADGGGFSVIITRPDGLACMLAAGTAMHEVDAPAPKQGGKS